MQFQSCFLPFVCHLFDAILFAHSTNALSHNGVLFQAQRGLLRCSLTSVSFEVLVGKTFFQFVTRRRLYFDLLSAF